VRFEGCGMKFTIDHPITSGETNVGFVRWAKWHIAHWLWRISRRWENDALDTNCRQNDDGILF
jgi:hypothetical protein